MKKILVPFLVGLLVGAAVLYLVLGRPSGSSKAAGGKTSFDRVAARLDQGGDLFFFYSLERLVPFVDEVVRTLKEVVPGTARQKEPMDQALKIFGQIGLGEIAAVGASSVPVDKDLFRTRMVVHHLPGKGQGLIWTLAGGENRDLDLLRRLPAAAALAGMFDLQAGKILDWLDAALPKDPSGKPVLSQGLAEAEAKGVPLKKMIASLEGPLGYVLTLNPEKKISFPAGDQPVEFPEPELALAVSVKDSTLFDFLKGMIPGAAFSEKDGLRRLQITAPPAPISLTPTILAKGSLVVAASTSALAETLVEGKSASRLAETEAFRRLSRGLPLRGTGFYYLGPGLMRTAMEVLGRAAPPAKGASAPDIAALIRRFLPADLELLAVAQNGPEGFVGLMNHSVPLEKLILLQIVPALAVPKAGRPDPAKLLDLPKI